jgi:surface antigen
MAVPLHRETEAEAVIELTPEILMAYVDGQLDSAQSREVEAALADDPAAREMVARFRRSSEILGAGLEGVLHEPVPQRLLDAARGEPARVVAFRPRTRDQAWHGWPGLAAAATVLLVVGITAGALLFGSGDQAVMTAASDPMQRALESQQSGSPWVAQDGAQVTPVLTFRAADGRPCREFESTTGDTASFGVACRDAQGRWVAQIEVQRGLLPAAIQAQHYLPAAGGTDPVSDVLDLLGAGPALTVEEEARLLESGWD